MRFMSWCPSTTLAVYRVVLWRVPGPEGHRRWRPGEEVEDGLPIAGRLGCGGGPILFFSPSRRFEAAGLQEGVGDHGHKACRCRPRPGSTFEVVEAEFLLELLMRLLADPSRLDRGGERLEGRLGR